ncbi:MAG: PQQ-dependent sugar dehydrogenase [Planctomycetota bacterium]
MRSAALALSFGTAALLAANCVYADLPSGNPIPGNVSTAFWSIELEEVVSIPDSGGTFARLEFLTGGGAPGQAYVIDQRGEIYSFDPSSPNPTPTVFLDLSTAVPNFNFQFQTGVRGMAFHPDFNNQGTDGYRKFYTSHSRNAFAPTVPGTVNPTFFNAPNPPGLDHDSVVGEWTVNANGTVNTSSYRELVRVGQPFTQAGQPGSDHNIGSIGFNPNAGPGDDDYGNLYIALGDGGGPNDPNDLAQNINTNQPGGATGFPHGSILRIDPIQSGGNPYTIPTDNPFAGQSGIIQEIWAYGLRNPHKFSFDTAGDGKMLISDIGQVNVEEINLGAPGANYGWVEREGTFLKPGTSSSLDPLPAGHPTDGFTYPVAQYDRNNGLGSGSWAVVGGSVYRGTNVPQLTGMYLFGDFATNSGPILAVDVDELIQREDFGDLNNLSGGNIAPYERLRLIDGSDGVEKTLLEIIQETNPGTNRTDLRFGVGPDDEIYILNKRDGIVRRIASASGLADGDTDRDGDVDLADLLTLQRNFGGAGDWSDGDVNGDAVVDGTDLALLEAALGSGSAVSGGAVSIPEPGAVSLVVAWCVVLAADGRRRAFTRR